MNRKSFIKSSLTSTLGITLLPTLLYGGQQEDKEPIETEVVKEFVTAGHSDLSKVKEMLAEHPNLISSRYDWGKGDFEEAIEGAGHLGDKEIAEYLINQGARVNLFVLTMLGKTHLVKPVIEEYPQLLMAKGAHGFTLLHHAKVGGDNSKELFDYLNEKGLTETRMKIK